MLKTGQSDLANNLLDRISSAWPENQWCDAKLIVAVSGGCDSVALLHCLQLLRKRTGGSGESIALYCNHNTRDACAAEADFVQQLARQLNCQYATTNFQDASNNEGPSENQLREFRYDSFVQTAQKFGARYVVTAHHADDQLETILFRIFRGTGLSGLTGVPRIRTDGDISFVRPLLDIRKCELQKLLVDFDQPFCQDDSNLESVYTRNYLRNEILPAVRHRFGPQSEDAILRLGDQAAEIQQFLDSIAEPIFEKSVSSRDGKASVELDGWSSQHSIIVSQLVRLLWKRMELPEREMTRHKWRQVSQLIMDPNPPASLQLPGNVTLSRIGDKLIVESTPPFSRKNDG